MHVSVHILSNFKLYLEFFLKIIIPLLTGDVGKKLMINTESFIPEGIIRPLDHDSLFRPNVRYSHGLVLLYL